MRLALGGRALMDGTTQTAFITNASLPSVAPQDDDDDESRAATSIHDYCRRPPNG